MSASPCYQVNAPAVAGEIIDGEAIILHLPRGHYFSSQGSGAFIWAGIERRMTLLDIAQALAARFDLSPPEAEAAVENFVVELAGHELIRPCDASEGTPADFEALPGAGPYAPPQVEVYTDMQDLLLLDPIHDVDAVGWPVAPDRAA